MATGTAVVNFGAFPGAADTSLDITGQAAIAAGTLVEAWVRPIATAEHSVDEHMVEQFNLFAANISAGTGFTIYAFEDGPTTVRNEGHRLYGTYTVAWAWL
jgi:hypothetical protein